MTAPTPAIARTIARELLSGGPDLTTVHGQWVSIAAHVLERIDAPSGRHPDGQPCSYCYPIDGAAPGVNASRLVACVYTDPVFAAYRAAQSAAAADEAELAAARDIARSEARGW